MSPNLRAATAKLAATRAKLALLDAQAAARAAWRAIDLDGQPEEVDEDTAESWRVANALDQLVQHATYAFEEAMFRAVKLRNVADSIATTEATVVDTAWAPILEIN